MKRITRYTLSLAASLALLAGSITMSAEAALASSNYDTIFGRVLKVDREARTLLVSTSLKKLYIVRMPEGSSARIFHGKDKLMDRPGFENINRNDIIEVRYAREDKERLARLDNGAEAVTVTAAR
jgi:hypothetical protein